MPTMVNQQLRQLQRQFLDSLPQRAHQLENLWRHLRYFNWSDQGFRTFQQIVHRLVGTGASYGLPEVSETAQMLDSYLTDCQALGQPVGGIEYEMIDQMVNTVVRTLSHIESPETLGLTTPPARGGEGKHIFVVESDHALSALIAAYLHASEFSVQYFETPAACLQQLNVRTPHAVLIDPCVPGDTTPGFDYIIDIKQRLPQGVPVLFMSARRDMHTRLRALRAGCAAYVTKPVDFGMLVKTLGQTIAANEITHKVMVVDDEPSIAAYHAEILRSAGMEVIVVTQPMHSLQQAAEFKPDLVILDMHMPDINGIELATLLRQSEQFLLLPIIFVTADTSTKLRKSIESLGVNGLLTKPVDMGALINAAERAIGDTHALKLRIEAITQRGERNNQITRSYFFAAIDNELQANQSHKTPTALYYLGLDVQEEFYREFGPAGVARLHEQFCQRLAQVMGSNEQWTDTSNFIACMLAGKRTREQHLARAQQIANQLSGHFYQVADSPLVINAHVGVHFLDTESGSVNSALLHAEQAYDEAKHAEIPLLHVEPEPEPEPEQAEPVRPASFPSMDFKERLPEENLRTAYQPMISLEHAQIEHFEALVRWRSDDDELIPAAKFLHHIEKSNMRVDLDRWVLQAAVNSVLTDSYARENASMFIHLADETLSQKSFFSFAANVLRSSRLRGQRRLVFIFEETWVAQHMGEATALINSLHNIHCGACLTHAGITDQTDMVLARIEFDYVRLNPELTSTLDGDHADRLKRVIAAAQSIGAQIIATQVEDSKNLSTLWLMGVRLFQGFLLQSPDQSIHSKSDMEFIRKFFSPTN